MGKKGYDVEVYGPQNNDGIRVTKYNSSNFPPVAGGGSEELSWGTDVLSDPAGASRLNGGYGVPGERVGEV